MPAFTSEFLIFLAMLLEAVVYVTVLINAIRRRVGQEFTVLLLGAFTLVALALQVGETAWRVGLIPQMNERGFQSVEVFGTFFLAFILISIVRTFVRREGWSWVVIGVLWAVGLVAVDSNLLGLPNVIWTNGQTMLPRDGLSLGWAILGWLLFMIGTVSNLLGALHQQRQPMHRNRLSYFFPIAFLLVLNDTFLLSGLTMPGNPFRLAATIVMGYVVLTHNLPDGRLILRRTLIYIITALLIVGFYLTIALGILPLFRAIPNYNQVTIGAIVAILLALIFTPLLGLVQRLVDRMLSIDKSNAGRTLHQYSETISNILDMQRLASVAVGLIIESMQLQRGFLFLVDTETGETGRRLYRLRAARADGEQQIKPITLDENNPIAHHMAREMKPLLQYDLDLLPNFRGIAPLEREWFDRLEAEVYAPIFTNRRWIGVLALGSKLSGNRFSDEDLVTVSALANQTAVALENAALVENLMKLNTELRQAYRDLDKANRDLERIDQTKSDFISIASHELRTPLTVMRGYTEMLLEDRNLEDSFKKVVSSLHKSTLRLHEIMDSLFDIAQLDARTLQLHLQQVDTAALIREVGNGLTKTVTDRRLALALDLPSLPTIKADPNILKKVFSHLLNNAVKFTPDNGSIHVSGAVVAPNGTELPNGGVELIVSDTGVGVDPEFRDMIFTKFYQPGDLAKHSTSKSRFKGGGAGLGLALSKGIVEAHGGRIWVESPGYDETKLPGSKFHVVLPLVKPENGSSIAMGNPVNISIGVPIKTGGK
jgi:signal transduction histidine kinase